MSLGLDKPHDTQLHARARILSIGAGSIGGEDPSSYRAHKARDSPFLANVPLVSKGTPHLAHKAIVHGDMLNNHVATAVLCSVPSAEGKYRQSALPPHEGSLINQILPKINDNPQSIARYATPDFSQYSVYKDSASANNSPMTPADLEKYTKNPLSAPHSRVLKRACPPTSAIPVTKSRRKSSDSTGVHQKFPVHELPGHIDRQFKSANTFLEAGKASGNFSVSDEDLDDTEIYQDIASSLPNSRGSNVSRAKPILSVDSSPTHKRPMRKLCFGHFHQSTMKSDSRGEAPSVDGLSKVYTPSTRSRVDANSRGTPVTENNCSQPIQPLLSTSFENACDDHRSAVSQRSYVSGGKLSSCSSIGLNNSPRLRLSTGQNMYDGSIDNSIQLRMSENCRTSGDRCDSIDMDLPVHLSTALLTIHEVDATNPSQQATDDAATHPVSVAACNPSYFVPHISSITSALENDSINEQVSMHSAECGYARLSDRRQYSAENFPVIDSAHLSGTSLMHSSVVNDDQDTGTFASSKQSVIHLLRGSTQQLTDFKTTVDPDQSASLLTDNLDECADSCIFIGKLGDDDGSADNKSCTLTPRCLNITSYCAGDDTSSAIMTDATAESSQPRPSSEEIISGLSSDDWQRQVDAITKCVGFFSTPSATTDNAEVQTIITSYITVLSSPRSKVIKHAIETLVPMFLTKHPALLHYADRIFTPLLLRVGSASQADFISAAGDRALHTIVVLAQPAKLMPHLREESKNKSPGVRLRVAQLFTIVFKEFSEDSQVVSHFRSCTEIYIETLLRLIGDSSEQVRKCAREAFTALLNMTRVPGESISDFLTRYKLCTVENLSRLKFLE